MNAYEPIPLLGQIGPDDHPTVHAFIQGMAEEASDAQGPGIERADSSTSIYLNSDITVPDDDQVVSPEIQNDVIAVVDIQTREPITAKLNPVETGEPSIDYWCGPQQIQPQVQVDPMSGQPVAAGMPFGLSPDQMGPWMDPMSGQQMPPNKLSEEQADAIEQAISAGVAKRNWLVRIDDKLVSEVYQTVKNVLASRSRFVRIERSNLLRTTIEGWSLWLYEWDDRRKRHVITPLSLRQVYIDPTVEDIDDAAYAGIDHYLDASKAKALYPHLAADIDEYAHTGQPRVPFGSGQLPGAFDRTFKRPMITLRIWWVRDQEIPVGRGDAIQEGLVQQVEVPDEQAVLGMQAAGQPIDPNAPPTRTALVHAESGEEVDEQSPNWPTRLGIRQLTELVETGNIVDDRECEYWDIPLLHNVSIPIPGSPEGIGMPYNLYKMQRGVTKTLTGMVEHIDNYAHSTPVLSETTAADLGIHAGDMWKQCGRAIIISPDTYRETQGQIHTINPPPPLNEGLVQVESILRSRMREDSGYTDKLRGITSGNESGRAIDLAQQAASSQIGFKSQRTGDWIYRRSMLELGSIRRMSVDDIGRIISKYPRHILEQIHQRFSRTEFDITVTVFSAAGQAIEMKKAAAREDFKLGLRDKESTREILGIDHQMAEENQRKEQRQLAEMANAMPQQQQEEQDKQEPPQNAA
jgi:hypothetical protein